MSDADRRNSVLIFVLVGAALVYGIAHWEAIRNPYVIADDVRQQIYWMQQWQDQELFQDDLLSLYARHYVPWGVQAIYYAASAFMNPVQFTKVVEWLLFICTAGFLFGIGLQFKDKRTAVAIVCASFFFSIILRKISGGMSQSFAFPLLSAYLFFLGRENILAGAVVILFQSLLNPYIFLLCLVTHAFFLIFNHRKEPTQRGCGKAVQARLLSKRGVLTNLPVIAGVIIIVLKYALPTPFEFGEIVTRSEMAGKAEYTSLGRYEIMPGSSLGHEIIRPWTSFFPFEEAGQAAGWISLIIITILGSVALTCIQRRTGWISLTRTGIDFSGFRVFAYLLPASFVLYFASDLLLMKIFLPRRYLEFSLTLFYATSTGVFVSMVVQTLRGRRRAFYFIFALLFVIAGVCLHNVGVFDYSKDAQLCRFLETTPKDCLIAGHPDIMDNVVTFARRKAFVTYELSHTWYTRYWEVIRDRTLDFFRAYYSRHPDEIKEFCRNSRIGYLVVRDMDFQPDRLQRGHIYFEPINGEIRKGIDLQAPFAVLDPREFPPVYQSDGVRVLKME